MVGEAGGSLLIGRADKAVAIVVDEGSVSIFVPIFTTISEDGVREAYLVVSNDEGSVSIFVPISATISEDGVREANLVVPKDEETGSISVPIFVSAISATISFDEVRETATISEGGVGEAMGHDDEEIISSATAGRISLSRADFPVRVIIDARCGAERGAVFVFVDTIDAVVSIGCCCCSCCIIVTIDTVLFCCIPVTSIGDDDGFAAAAAGASTHL